MFGRKKNKIDPSIIKILEEQFNREINSLKLEMEKLTTHVISLRASFNARLGKAATTETETLKNKDGLDSLR